MSLGAVDRSRFGWWLLGAGLCVVLLFVIYSFIGTFVFGIFLYYATRPIYRRLRRRLDQPSLSAAISLFALALPALALASYALLVVVTEIDRVINDGFDIGAYPGVDQELLERLSDPEFVVSGGLNEYVSPEDLVSVVRSLTSAADTLAFVGVGLVHLFIIVALAFYLLRDDRRLSRWALQRFGDDRGILQAYARAVDNDFNSIFFGNILNAVLTGSIGVLAYSLLNVIAPPGLRIPAAPLVGLLAGAASLIPVVGMKLVYFPVGIYMTALAVLGGNSRALWFVGVFATTSFVVVDTIPDLILRPYVSGRNLHVGAVMLAYTFGPLLFGWYGIFLMPMLLVFVVHFARLVLPELIAGRPVQPYAVDPSYLVDRPVPSGRDGTLDGDADSTSLDDAPEVPPDESAATDDSGTSTSDRPIPDSAAEGLSSDDPNPEEKTIRDAGLGRDVRPDSGVEPGTDG
jgi:predicted PurR-regulated permease PerM